MARLLWSAGGAAAPGTAYSNAKLPTSEQVTIHASGSRKTRSTCCVTAAAHANAAHLGAVSPRRWNAHRSSRASQCGRSPTASDVSAARLATMNALFPMKAMLMSSPKGKVSSAGSIASCRPADATAARGASTTTTAPSPALPRTSAATNASVAATGTGYLDTTSRAVRSLWYSAPSMAGPQRLGSSSRRVPRRSRLRKLGDGRRGGHHQAPRARRPP
mmetsp:Transcript_25142/g.87725  ORF Transcript_25142/g.87725 Transcript_25142/m.87725 type:complete len:218 (+) Transcript_25142:2082-2735(+)